MGKKSKSAKYQFLNRMFYKSVDTSIELGIEVLSERDFVKISKVAFRDYTGKYNTSHYRREFRAFYENRIKGFVKGSLNPRTIDKLEKKIVRAVDEFSSSGGGLGPESISEPYWMAQDVVLQNWGKIKKYEGEQVRSLSWLLAEVRRVIYSLNKQDVPDSDIMVVLADSNLFFTKKYKNVS